jgi:TPR repeat protein
MIYAGSEEAESLCYGAVGLLDGAVDGGRAVRVTGIFVRAGELGNAEAMAFLGPAMTRRGVTNDAEGVGWLRKAAERNHRAAMFLLSVLLSGLRRGGKDAVPEGLMWCQRAAGLGCVESMHNCGSILLSGFGVNRNPFAAAEWYEKAALRGSEGATLNLVALPWGMLGQTADTMEARAVEAVGWIRKGVAMGSARTMHYMASAYRMGIGVKRDSNAALRWERRALAGGSA